MRDGTLLSGTLTKLVGSDAEVQGTVLGMLAIPRDNLAGAFFAPQNGQPETIPALARYSDVLAAALGAYGSALQPGRRCRILFAGRDELFPARIMRIGPDTILLTNKDKGVETLSRQFVRVILNFAVPLMHQRRKRPALCWSAWLTAKCCAGS